MSNYDIIKQRGTTVNYKDNRGGAVLYPHPIIGVVKNNIDGLRSGTIEVFLKRLNASDEDNPDNWTTIRYASPFFGYTPNTGSPNSDGTFKGNRNSYGFWATPPDIGTEVICVFINGQPDLGYYVASIPPATLTHMVPAVASSNHIIPNASEATAYGGAERLPVTEYNDANIGQYKSPEDPDREPRPIHSYQAAILYNQGLIRDPNRGTISSSSLRESPSRVFGLSTPGRPIYQGGYGAPGQQSIADAIQDDTIPDENFKVVGRLGGHSIVMDDGTLEGDDQLMRIRTASGHMIMMNDYAGTLFIIHANGLSYIELGKEGTIDMYATNSVNIRTQGDLNLHADNNININAGKTLNVAATNIKVESSESTTQYTGTVFEQFTKGDHTLKVNSSMSFHSKGDSMVKSGGTNYIKGGPDVKLNTGESSLVPDEVPQLKRIDHTDTLRDADKGYIPAPGKLPSIVTRAPAHSPWANANQGVDVKVDLSSNSSFPAAPSNELITVNLSTENAAITPTNNAVASTVPITNSYEGVESSLDQATSSTLVSQMAVNASETPAKDAIATEAGIVETGTAKTASISPMALTPSQLSAAGYIKPGADVAANKAIQEGKTLEEALPPNVWTGKNGVTSLQGIINNSSAQTDAASTILVKSEQAMKQAGVITGKESSTQTGGVVLAAATVGVAATVNYYKSTSNNTSNNPENTTPTTSNASSTTSAGVENIKGAFGSDVKNVIASGNSAANLADKTGTTSGVSSGGLKGAIAGAFDKIVKAFKSLVPNKPQTLDPPPPTTDAGTTGVPNIPGGAAAVSNQVNLSESKPKITVASALSTLAKISAAAAILLPKSAGAKKTATTAAPILALGGLIANALSKSKSTTQSDPQYDASVKSQGGVTNIASAGLADSGAAELQGATNSISSGSPSNKKTPTVAAGTFNFAEVQSRTNSLMGDPGVPGLNLGAGIPVNPPSAEQSKKYDELNAELKKQDNLKWDLRKVYFDNKKKYGESAPETVEADNAYKECLQKIESLRKEISQL